MPILIPLIFPASGNRTGTIIVGILAIIEMAILIYLSAALAATEDISSIGAIFLMSLLLLGIGFSIILIFGAVKENERLVLPFLAFVGCGLIAYLIWFIIELVNDYNDKKWQHFGIICLNLAFLIVAGAYYRDVKRRNTPYMQEITISP